MPLHDLSRRVVLLTGIGSIAEGWGNGAAIACTLARQGAIVFGCDINVEAAKTACEKINNDEQIKSHSLHRHGAARAEILETPVDVTKAEQCKKFVDACLERFGRVDILVNNVGLSQPGGPAEMSEEVWDAQVDVNLKSVYLMCNLVLPIMEAQTTGGSVLNISSVAGLRYIGKPQVAYAATKAAIIQFTKTTAVIYAQRTQGRVRLNTVIPGLIDTPLVSILAQKYAGGDVEGYRKVRDGQVPMGKMGTSWDVANAGLYLVSDEAKYVTGQEICVDGGLVSSTGRI